MRVEVEITFRDWEVAGVAFLPSCVEVRLRGHAILLRALVVVRRKTRPEVTTARLRWVAIVARRTAPSQI